MSRNTFRFFCLHAFYNGSRYEEENKGSQGRPKFDNILPSSGRLLSINGETHKLIAKQSNVSKNTVLNAHKFSKAITEIVNKIGIKRKELTSKEGGMNQEAT